jgi:hypothetical protein
MSLYRVPTALLFAACSSGPPSGDGLLTVSATALPRTISQATLSITLSRPASVAAACTRREEPSEVHLLEGSGTDEVSLDFAGLLSAADYDCRVAPTTEAGEAVSVSFRTPDPPEQLATASVERGGEAEMTGAYTVMAVHPECSGQDLTYIAVLDPEGENRWRYDLPPGTNIGVEVTLDGYNRFLWGGGQSSEGAPAVVDVTQGEVWKLSFPGDDTLEFHHDGSRIEDGRVLSVEEVLVDGWLAFQLRLSDETSTSWMWNVTRAVETGWLRAGDSVDTDPHHLNWADVVDSGEGPVAYGSLCYSGLVLAIDVASGEPLWKFGKDGDFVLVDPSGQPLPDDAFPQCQHGLQMDGTHLLVYDNGHDRERTRAVEYELDLARRVATQTWVWEDDGFFEPYHGGVDWLTPDHRRVLVAESANGCQGAEARHSQVVEVDRDTGEVVHRLVLRDLGNWIYRAHRVDGCELFANAARCPRLAERLEELRPVLGL